MCEKFNWMIFYSNYISKINNYNVNCNFETRFDSNICLIVPKIYINIYIQLLFFLSQTFLCFNFYEKQLLFIIML